MESEKTPEADYMPKESNSINTGSSIQDPEEEKFKKESESDSKYSSTTKTVGKYNFSFVTVSPK